MKSTGTRYSHQDSYTRMVQILNAADVSYVKTDSLPPRERLTFNNGFYAYCSAMFVDIRESSKLPDKYRRPKLAKLYRAYISEVVAVMDGSADCREVNIVGDGVWGVFDTPTTDEIDDVFATSAEVSSAIIMLNYALRRHDYEPIRVGIGLSYGRALVVKAGYSGSGINDIVYMGDVVNQAAKLAAHGNENYGDGRTMVSQIFYQNLKSENQRLLTWSASRHAWHGNIVDSAMEAWFEENCQ
ncbi:adenylate/guanylate cyclase domain-containing protein [Dactylosporangium vinaceum]|uniref:Adenylate/guanylate cyclase domain-containing protein n=1 Tax=Dactylosporangium vinaceum TaxID=53362 RepID=A0ABV5MQN2_9ACTN|nr:adenylate/guanylate cyclase domain-containing protein [Dactylosporangium vinaceum]UAB96411.1 adenylate/guanylate cyclase domain-containing protein [Dactylosporangium vinaceum]